MKSNIAFSFYAVTRYIVIHRLSRGQGDKGVKKDLSPPKAATPEARRCGNERLDSVKVTVTGATGLIGSRLCGALRKRGDEVTAVAREWPPEVLARRDAVVHLAGERIAQRWSEEAMAMIRASRVEGTHRLVDALGEADPRPRVLVCASGADYYGDTGDQRGVRQGARARAAAARRPPHPAQGARVALRRHGPDRDPGRTPGAGTRAEARVPVPAP